MNRNITAYARFVTLVIFAGVVLIIGLQWLGPAAKAQVARGKVVDAGPDAMSRLTAFCNSSPITIPTSGAASPYPSGVTVSGLTGVVGRVTVTLNNFSHTFSGDVSFLLVDPSGRSVVVLGQAGQFDGAGAAVSNATVTLDDTAAANVSPDQTILSGTFRPTNYIGSQVTATFPAPAPAATTANPYFSTLYRFRGVDPNGTWKLYAVDSFPSDSGTVAGGWCIDITTQPSAVQLPFTVLSGSIAGNEPTQTGRLFRSGMSTQASLPTTCPGQSSAGVGLPFFYDTFTFTNRNVVSVPVTFTGTSTSTCAGGIFLAAYIPSYAPLPNNECPNYVADAGSSPTGSASGPAFSLNMAPGQTITLVASQSDSANLCGGYSILAEGFVNAPTAAGVMLSGRVLAADDGRGVVNAIVNLTDAQGRVRSVSTQHGGAYTFADVELGHAYTLTVTSSRYNYAPRVIEIHDDLTGLNFIPE